MPSKGESHKLIIWNFRWEDYGRSNCKIDLIEEETK